MTKRRLTQQQQRRIAQHQHTKQSEASNTFSSLQHHQSIAILTAHFGRRAEVMVDKPPVITCSIRQNLPPLVAGDNVVFEMMTPIRGVIVALLPRTSVLSRTTVSGETRIMAANVSQVFVVIAPEPEPNWLVLDRYLVGLAQCDLPATLLINKCDLPISQTLQNHIQLYQKIGYPVMQISALDSASLVALNQQLQDQASIFIGQSGVGKSSLIQGLLPHENLRTGALSTRTRLGAHTTTTARLYPLPQGGFIVDSPGIRDFGLNSIHLDNLASGFIEFRPYLGTCKFKSCHHLHEPECALLKAESEGFIFTERLQNYQTLYQELHNAAKEYGKHQHD